MPNEKRIDIHILPVGPLQANCYILADPGTKEALVVDPGAEPDRILARLAGLQVVRILLTHAHYDHIGALDEVRNKTGAPAFIHRAEAEWLVDPRLNGSLTPWSLGKAVRCAPADGYLDEGQAIDFSTIRLTVAHTPGHSPGGVSFIGPDFVLTGDALFRGSIGRTDLPGGDHRQLLTSIRKHLLTLADSTVVFPGHGPTTTIGDERRTNPFLAGP